MQRGPQAASRLTSLKRSPCLFSWSFISTEADGGVMVFQNTSPCLPGGLS